MKHVHLYVAAMVAIAVLACFCGSCRKNGTEEPRATANDPSTNVFIKLEKSRVFIAVPPFDLKGGSPAGGRYEGRGVSDNRFSPEEAGVGVHEIVYTYMGVSASDCIEVFGARQRRAAASCAICNGTGLTDCAPRVMCEYCTGGRVRIGACMACDGVGRVRTAWKLWFGTRDCPNCQGTGSRYAQCKKCKGRAYVKCPDCKGTGKAVCKCVR